MEKNLFKFLGIFESNTLTAALCAASPTKKFNYFFFPLPTLLKFIYSLLLFTETVLSYSVKCFWDTDGTKCSTHNKDSLFRQLPW